MAPVSKGRSNRPHVRRKKRPAIAPLHAPRDPIRKQEVDSKRVNELERLSGNSIALSRSPFEAWRHQNQFIEGVINDCEFAVLLLMKLSKTPFPK
jgi:hypothetical protein